jgi:hypothetical protein
VPAGIGWSRNDAPYGAGAVGDPGAARRRLSAQARVLGLFLIRQTGPCRSSSRVRKTDPRDGPASCRQRPRTRDVKHRTGLREAPLPHLHRTASPHYVRDIVPERQMMQRREVQQ